MIFFFIFGDELSLILVVCGVYIFDTTGLFLFFNNPLAINFHLHYTQQFFFYNLNILTMTFTVLFVFLLSFCSNFDDEPNLRSMIAERKTECNIVNFN
jgi:hypothetical protein